MTDPDVRQKAQKRISELTNEAMRLINEAENIADEAGISFSFDVAYGMGGTYAPKGTEAWSWGENKIREEGEWLASSHSC